MSDETLTALKGFGLGFAGGLVILGIIIRIELWALERWHHWGRRYPPDG